MTSLVGEFETDLSLQDALVACAGAIDGLGWEIEDVEASRIVSYANPGTPFSSKIEVVLIDSGQTTDIRITGTDSDAELPSPNELMAVLDRARDAIQASVEGATDALTPPDPPEGFETRIELDPWPVADDAADDGLGLNLDFVHPPLLPGMDPYEPVVGPKDAARELHSIAASLREEQAWGPEDTERLARGIDDPAVAEVYAAGVPFVARLITVELDTRNKRYLSPKRGGGSAETMRPIRLQSSDVRREAGTILEQLTFRGFAIGAAATAVDLDTAAIIDVETIDWWRRFVGGIAAHYGGLVESGAMHLDPLQSAIAGITLIISGPVLERYRDFAEEHHLGRGPNPFGKARAASYPFYFLATGWSLFSAHTDKGRGG
jgi:hypothetical protein